MRQKSITLGIRAGGLVPWALKSEAEGSAFTQPHNLQFLLFLVRIRPLQQGLAHLYIRFLSGEDTSLGLDGKKVVMIESHCGINLARIIYNFFLFLVLSNLYD